MRLCQDLRRRLDPEMVSAIEHTFTDSTLNDCLVECTNCRGTARCTRFANGDIVISCSCGFRQQGRWTDKPCTDSGKGRARELKTR